MATTPDKSVDADEASNPHVSLIQADIGNIAEWARRDGEILRRRLCERKKTRTRPYKGAPNPVEPIVDDTVREKTTEEIAMVSNAPRFAQAIPLEDIQPQDLAQIELAFDTYFRFMIGAQPLVEEAIDTKNARGYAVMKVTRTDSPRWGEIPTFEPRDPRCVVVPTGTKAIGEARRITDIYRFDPDEFEEIAKARGWSNVTAVKEAATEADYDGGGAEDLTDAHGETATLIGLEKTGKGTETVLVYEHWHYATAWDVENDPAGADGEVVEGERCCIVFSPAAPDKILDLYPWKEKDELIELSPEEQQAELMAAIGENREPEQFRLVRGEERAWPFVQSRYENRSRFFYDTRGLGHLCMDNQIGATALSRAKMTMMDYYMAPMFTGDAKPSTNITHEPGSFLPGDVKYVQPPQVPQQLDFDIQGHRRTAGRRAHAGASTEFSENMAVSRKVQKTAREVEEESTRGAVLSSADVDRFNFPWGELYMQLWDDLRRIGKPLPMIANGKYLGEAGPQIFQRKILWVPASSAKTLNPDQQFARARVAWQFAQGFIQLGVTLDPQAALMDTLQHWDPQAAARWLPDTEKGPMPVYKILQQLAQKMQELGGKMEGMEDLLKKTAKLAIEADEKASGESATRGGDGQ